ncbi:hypothetical protein [Hydrogenophaga sp.]|uniref:phage tail protein n=1 Tax=Hydrogenophaga sp. TaxID=1904254 RepID=UPI00286D8C73|nr:hypothetical protein [Hydrogenophaga sp.]
MFEAPRPSPQATRRPAPGAAPAGSAVTARVAALSHPPGAQGRASHTGASHNATGNTQAPRTAGQPQRTAQGAPASGAPEVAHSRASTLPHYLQTAARPLVDAAPQPVADPGSTAPVPAPSTTAAASTAAPLSHATPATPPVANGLAGEASAAVATAAPGQQDGAGVEPATPQGAAQREKIAKDQTLPQDGKARADHPAKPAHARLKGPAAEHSTSAPPAVGAPAPVAASKTPPAATAAPQATATPSPATSAAGAGPAGGAGGGASTSDAGGDAGGGEATPDSDAAAAGAGGTAAEAVREQTEDKMAAAHPEGAAEEAQAEPATAADSGPGEADTGGEQAPGGPTDTGDTNAGDNAAGASAAGAPATDSDDDTAAEAAPSAATANAATQTDPEATQRAQATSEAREHSQDSQRVAENASEEHADDQAEQQADASAGASAPAGAELSSAEAGAGLADLGETVGGGGDGGGAGAAGGGGGGAAAPATDEAAPPDLAAQDPADGLGAAAALGPVQAGAALGSVGSAIERTAGEEGQALQDQMPNPEVGEDGASSSAVQPLADDAQAERPQAVQPGASPATPQPAPTPPAGPAPVAGVAEPQVSAGEGGKVSSEDGARVQGAVDALPTHDPGLDVPAGAPPQVQLSGEADPASADQQKAELDQTVATQRQQGAADAAAPAGENAIRSTRPREVLKPPEIAQGGAAGGGKGAADAGAAAEGLAIIANQKKGPEVRAAMAQAQAEMAGKKGEHQQKVSAEKDKNDEQMAALRAENAAEQAAEKAGARSEVAKARSDWTAEQRKAIDATGQKAGQELAKGHTKVAQEQRQADDKATQHIGDGEREAGEAKAGAERDAAAKKAEAKKESGGVFGWLSSKVSSFFNAIKRGITAIFDAAKRLVRAAIDKAKKLAVAVIEAARKAIVAVIKAVGAALIALGDVLLAAFPNLKRRFRSFIEAKVKAAENAVNRLADALKKGVTKLLDALGKAFEFLLDAYKKAMFMVLDAAKAVVDGAIKAAKAVADLVGTFIVLIKDIAANPGGWIANLGAAVMDGVKNHLWKAFKTAVKGWFDDKLEQVLGVGTAIWSVLKKGGIAIKDVGKMAFEALKAAIPQALIQLLIEKVVAMIVPAAGAVMAIIEGLQAAWGTVQRIIAALGKFVSFLKAVKAGGAGPQFADLLASAAIVVIDFVANWLLKKLRGPASKVGAKVKAIAQKIMAKLKAVMKKVGGALKKVAKKIGGAVKKGKKRFDDWRAKRKAKKDSKNAGKKKDAGQKKQDKDEEKKDRLRKAVEAIRPQVASMAGKGKLSGMLLKARLLMWRVRYRLTSLQLKVADGVATVVAKVNPSEEVSKFVAKFGVPLRKLIYKAADDVMNHPDVQAAADKAAAIADGKPQVNDKGETEQPKVESGAESLALAAQLNKPRPSGQQANVTFAGGGTAQVTRDPAHWATDTSAASPGLQHVRDGGAYINHVADVQATSTATGASHQTLHQATTQTFLGRPAGGQSPAVANFGATQALLKIAEISRNPAGGLISLDTAHHAAQGTMSTGGAVAADPMTGISANDRRLNPDKPGYNERVAGSLSEADADKRKQLLSSKDAVKNAGKAQELATQGKEPSGRAKRLRRFIRQQLDFVARVLQAEMEAGRMLFNSESQLTSDIEKQVHKAILDRFKSLTGLPD